MGKVSEGLLFPIRSIFNVCEAATAYVHMRIEDITDRDI